jgi:hypothetical protein
LTDHFASPKTPLPSRSVPATSTWRSAQHSAAPLPVDVEVPRATGRLRKSGTGARCFARGWRARR